MKLLISKKATISQEYDIILVIVERLTKYRIFLLQKKNYNTNILAQIFVRYIIINYRILKKIISDKDKLFISKFWEIFTKIIGINKVLFIVFTQKQINKLNE